jgi:hypothetical protein
MLKEIIIWPTEDDKGHQRGAFFEKLSNDIFSTQRYKISGNINVTGQEFDLVCEHMDRTNEKCLVECKAKKSLSSTEIKKFVFSVEFEKFDFGYFLYTKDYEHQVGGLINDLKNDDRYKNLYFFDANKVIELLVSSNAVREFSSDKIALDISKVILLYSFKGVYYVPILSTGTLPTHFCILNAKDLSVIDNENEINAIQEYIDDIKDLDLYKDAKQAGSSNTSDIDHDEMETVAEIQSSDSWDDPRPAALKYFVGRKKHKDKIFSFLNDVRDKVVDSRAFYIDGKSGWGKSSLMSDLRERCRNKHYRNKYLSAVIDSRSANSSNFLPLAYNLLITKAIKEEFIPKKFKNIIIPSSFDILGDPLTAELMTWLENNSRILILVFDQFEDVFRKENVFKSFYKFLVDVNNSNTNIIVGFSWKSEVNIPIGHKAYHLWQQSRDLAFKVTLDGFEVSESQSIIKQLEKDISEKFDIDFKRKIVDNSQGYPWLVKKLCIHIKKKISLGLSSDDLYEQDFQVMSLFETDLEELSSPEVKAIRYIANRAYNDQAFDVTELDEIINSEILAHLIHKRLVIKSGTKYNIYWDIFRDYLVLNEIPIIGETYLIRQTVNSVFEAYSAFSNHKAMDVNLFLETISNSVAEGAALNLLRELRSLGLVNYKNGEYKVKVSEINIDFFKTYIHEKLEKHSFTIELRKIQDREISLLDIAQIIGDKIQTKNFSIKTLETYAQVFLGWLDYSGIIIPNLSKKMMLRAKNALSYTPQMKPADVIGFVTSISDKYTLTKNPKEQKLLYDAKSLGLLTYSKDTALLTDIGREIHEKSETERFFIFSEQAKKMEKIKISYDALIANPEVKSKDFKDYILGPLEGINSQEYTKITARCLFLWANFILDVENSSKI